MPVTLKDIALECGLSKSTVSLALSDKPTRVAPQTQRRVREVAERLNYHSNQLAVGLATKRSKVVGMILGVDDLRNQYISETFMLISSGLRQMGYTLIYDTSLDMDNCIDGIARLLSFGIGGLIFGLLEPITPTPEFIQMIDYVYQTGLPVVFYSVCTLTKGRGSIVIDIDYEHGGYIATKHLTDLGHRCVGCVSGNLDYHVSADRLNGYKRALSEAGIPFDEELVYEGDYSMQSGYDALPYLLGQNVTAIFAFNDLMACGIYQAARNYNINIPHHISIVGFDNTYMNDVLSPPLTSVDIHAGENCKSIVDDLIEMIQHGVKELKVNQVKPNLIVRSSTRRFLQNQ